MSTKVVPCNLCQKKLSDRRSLKKHLMAVHKIDPVKLDYICGHCELEDKSLRVIWEHVVERHKTIDETEERRICLYDMNVFQNDRAYATHMLNEHGLPAWDVSREILTSIQPETAFDGAVRTYDIVPMETEVDLLALFVTKRDQIEELILQNTIYEPQKAQLSAEVTLEKEKADGTEEVITIFANCKMLAVDVQGWTQDQFYDCVDQILSTVHQYASHGSGWRIRRIDKIVLRMVKSAPIRGSSYLPLPADLLKLKRFLLNIRNYEDDRCFEYCFVAEYHRQNNIPLTLRTMQSREEEKASFYDYRRNSRAHEPTGDFVYPMGLPAIARFEILNEVQVNVFRLVEVLIKSFFLLV